MPIAVDRGLLAELGLGALSRSQGEAVLKRFTEVMEKRVGARISKLMSERNMDEFETLIPSVRYT